MNSDNLHRFVVLRPLRVGARLAGIGEAIYLPPIIASEWVLAGALRPAPLPVPRLCEPWPALETKRTSG